MDAWRHIQKSRERVLVTVRTLQEVGIIYFNKIPFKKKHSNYLRHQMEINSKLLTIYMIASQLHNSTFKKNVGCIYI